jgi:3D (Asp-Asp-Asp) domain-containing protein
LLLATALLLSRALAQSQEETPDGALLTPPAAIQAGPEPVGFPSDPVVGFPTDPVAPIATDPVAPPVVAPIAPAPTEPTKTEPVRPVQVAPLPVQAPQIAVPRAPTPSSKPDSSTPSVNVETPARPKAAPAVIATKPVAKPTVKPAWKPTVKPAIKPAAKPARKPVVKPAVARVTTSGRTMTVRSTAYNSLPGQTDASPFKTATGARTRFGVVALSRDLLRSIPYGSRVVLEDMGSWSNGSGRGKYNRMLSGMVFVVEDTMHPRKTGTVDVWFPARRQAIQWGARRLRLRIVQLGR